MTVKEPEHFNTKNVEQATNNQRKGKEIWGDRISQKTIK
jgi:hypothetical protein